MSHTNRISHLLLVLIAFAIGCADASSVSAPPDTPAPVRLVEVQGASAQLEVGATTQLTATPKDAAGRPLVRPTTWQSLRPTVATVSDAGLVTGVAPGDVTIQATSEGIVGQATIRIVPVPVHAVTISQPTMTLDVGGEFPLSAVAVDRQGNILTDRAQSWESLDPQVVSVNAQGRLTALSEGFTVVRVTIEGVRAESRVFVRPIPVDRVVLSDSTVELEIGDVAFLSARTLAANGAELTGRLIYWGSSEPSVVSVASNGRLVAYSTGTVRLTVESEGRATYATVKVDIPPAQGLIFDRISPAGVEIFLRDRLGTTTRMNAGNVSRHPSPSPDGRRFAFAVVQPHPVTGALQQDLYVVDRTGLNMRWLTRMDGVESEPAWSPDGTRIAYAGSDGASGDLDIFVVDVDGQNVVNLTPGTSFSLEQSPAWSPDGTTIAYSSLSPVGGSHIYVVNIDGTGRRRVDQGASMNARHPTFAPDGQSIAWSRSLPGSATGVDIVIATLAGAEQSVLELPGDQLNAVWSADGQHFAFAQLVNAEWNVYTVRRDGALVRHRAAGGNPAWINHW